MSELVISLQMRVTENDMEAPQDGGRIAMTVVLPAAAPRDDGDASNPKPQEPAGVVDARLWMNFSQDDGMEEWPQTKADKLGRTFTVEIYEGEDPVDGALPAKVTINDLENPGEGGRVLFMALISDKLRVAKRGMTQLETIIVFGNDEAMANFPSTRVDMERRRFWILIGGFVATVEDAALTLRADV